MTDIPTGLNPTARAWAGAALCLCVIAAQAQQVPNAAQPGRPQQDLKAEPAPAPRDVPLRLDAARFPEQVPAGADKAAFILRAIEVEGNTVLSSERLLAAWQPRMGQSVTLADVFALAADISAQYRREGYVLSQALLPAQDIRAGEGRVKIQVLEGYVAKVEFVGPAAALAPTRRLDALLQERPLRLRTLERHLLLLNELPGLTARASLKASDQPAASDLIVALDRQRFAGQASLHNRAAESTGPLRLNLGGEWRGVLGDFDRHGLRWSGSGNSRFNYLGYDAQLPLGVNGGRIDLGLSTSRSEPEASDGQVPVKTKSSGFNLGTSYPLIRSRDTNVGVRLGLGGNNGKTDLLNGASSSDEKSRVLRVGLSWDQTDAARGINLVDLEFSKGLSGLGASKDGDSGLREGVNYQGKKLSAYLARLQSLGGPVTLLLAAQGQSSSDVLYSGEQFGLGGENFLRAYDPSELLGDKGLAGKVELRLDTGWFASRGGGATLYGYADHGQVQSNNPLNPSRHSAQSYGLGLRFTLPHQVKGYLEVAKPRHFLREATLTDPGHTKVRVFAGLGIDF